VRVGDHRDAPGAGTGGRCERAPARLPGVARGVLGVATCDKGLPAMMMTLASLHNMPGVLVPGGVMLATLDGEDTGRLPADEQRRREGAPRTRPAADVGHIARSSARENLGRELFTVDFDSGQKLILFAHEIELVSDDLAA